MAWVAEDMQAAVHRLDVPCAERDHNGILEVDKFLTSRMPEQHEKEQAYRGERHSLPGKSSLGKLANSEPVEKPECLCVIASIILDRRPWSHSFKLLM